MFSSSKNIFKDRQCPSVKTGRLCRLLACPFDHDVETGTSERPSKRRKVETDGGSVGREEIAEIAKTATKAVPPGILKRTESPKPAPVSVLLPKSTKPDRTAGSSSTPTRTDSPLSVALSRPEKAPTALKSAQKPPAPQPATYATRPVPSAAAKPSASGTSDAQHLMPTPTMPCPGTVAQRMAYLKAIHDALVTQKPRLKYPKRAAILEELHLAKKSKGSYMVYTNEARVLVKNIKAGTWKTQKTEEPAQKPSLEPSKVLPQLTRLADKTTAPLLAQNGYPVTIPDPAKSTLPPNIGIMNCDRCDKAFDVPKVDKYGSCRYHWARPRLGGNSQFPERIFPCCNEMIGQSHGCTESPRHVYKLQDLHQLAAMSPFVETPKSSKPPVDGSSSNLGALGVAIDCEMCYTTLGMELCRVTAVNFTGKCTLDRTVRPLGKVLDYNTRFSGISDIEDPIKNEMGQLSGPVTFAEARRLLFKLVDSSTFLIGHGLENDLIALRLCHLRIIDTSILYPEFNPKRKTALRTLALNYLKRTIQTGEHDSMEDAVAALDVVKFHLK